MLPWPSLGKVTASKALLRASSPSQLGPRLAVQSPAPALEGCILEDGTGVKIACSDTENRHALAQIRSRKVQAHLTGLVTGGFTVTVSKLPIIIHTPALYGAVRQHLPQAM